jgi:uncharacterized membrane protein
MDFWKEFNNSCMTLFAGMFGASVALILFTIISTVILLLLCSFGVYIIYLIGEEIQNLPQSTLLLWRL